MNKDCPQTRSTQRRIRRAFLALAAVGGLALVPPSTGSDIEFKKPRTTSSASQGEAQALSTAFRNVANTLGPSVVYINAIDRPPFAMGNARGFGGQAMPSPGQGRNPHRTPNRIGQGTGVIVSENGFVLTNNHVVEGADEVLVTLHDGREVPGRFVGTDAATDLALLQVDAGNLQPAEFSDSNDVQVGDWVVALGSPFGLRQTLTAGIVSAIGRGGVGLATYEDYIQTDAAINPGNSGGPLANIRGEVIGINSAMSSANGGNAGIGFAIPSRIIQQVANDLMRSGSVSRGWLGVNIQPLDPGLAQSFGHDSRNGVLVSSVIPNAPADRSGILPGDIIIRINDRAMKNPRDLAMYVAELEPRTKVLVTLVRDGRTLSRTTTLTTRPVRLGSEDKMDETPGETHLGMDIVPLSEELAKEANLESRDAVFVRGVQQDSPAASNGIQPGDSILRVNGIETGDLDSFRVAMADLQRGEPIRMLVERGGACSFVMMNGTEVIR
ncbi:MAG: Do family serine endopeptidase [Phycisphaerales bacterium]|nr:Do family serine endopeptidase [Phycisphaerales bacterium]